MDVIEKQKIQKESEPEASYTLPTQKHVASSTHWPLAEIRVCGVLQIYFPSTSNDE